MPKTLPNNFKRIVKYVLLFTHILSTVRLYCLLDCLPLLLIEIYLSQIFNISILIKIAKSHKSMKIISLNFLIVSFGWIDGINLRY